ncbi:hypothetical protein WN943_019274 [Citrus x changshan-huyou]
MSSLQGAKCEDSDVDASMMFDSYLLPPLWTTSPPISSKVSFAKLAPLEAVLFEVDGTLCDSDPLHHHALSQMLQEIGYNGGVPITEEFFVEDFAGKSDADMAKFLFLNHLPRRMKFCDDKEAIFRR